jgi:citrate synthase
MVMSDPALLSAAEVAHRLGVKRETVYAYVSRGLLERHPASAHRRSLFEREAVQQLATRARSGDRSDALEVVVETQVTLLDPDGRLFYRGQDAAELARFSTFERVAGLLWGGPAGAPWELDAASAAIVGRLAGVLPANTPAVDRIPVVIGALGAADPLRSDRRPEAVRRTAGRILAGALDGLPAAAPTRDRSAAARLWAALSPEARPPRPVQLATLDACLVLLADHELAASTLAARVAASAWADPYRVVLAGLGPLGGALHGASPLAVESMLAQIAAPEAAFATVERVVAAGGPPAGFGHRVYRDRDPRADHLLARVGPAATDDRAARTVAALVEAGAALGLPAPNVDLAVAGLVYAMGLAPASASTIFTIARIAGLVAHAIEEYPHRLRFRPRATYGGPAPRR